VDEARAPPWELTVTAIPRYAGYQKNVRGRLPVAVVERV
jgi:hypothetical protein